MLQVRTSLEKHVEVLGAEKDELTAEVAKARESTNEIRDELTAEINSHLSARSQLETELDDCKRQFQTELFAAEDRYRELGRAKDVAEEKVSVLEKDLESLRSEKDTLAEDAAIAAETANKLQDELASERDSRAQLEAELNDCKYQFQSDLAAAGEKYLELRHAKDVVDSRVFSLELDLESTRVEKDRLVDEAAEAVRLTNTLRDELASEIETRSRLESELSELTRQFQSEMSTAHAKYEDLSGAKNVADDQLNRVTEEFVDYQKKQELTLSNMREESESRCCELEVQIGERDTEIKILSDQLRRKNVEVESIGTELEVVSVTSARHEAEAQHLRQTLDKERIVQHEAMEKISDQLQQKDTEFQFVCRELEAVSAKFVEKESEALCLQETLESERVSWNEDAEKLTEQLRQKTAELESQSRELEAVSAKFAEKESEALCLQETLESEHVRWNEDVEKLTEQLHQKTAELESQSRELEAVSAKFAEKAAETVRLQETVEKERVRYTEQLEAKIAEYDKAAERLSDELWQRNAKLESIGKQLEDVTMKFERQQAETLRLQETLDTERIQQGAEIERVSAQLQQKNSEVESVGKELEVVFKTSAKHEAEALRLEETLAAERIQWDEAIERSSDQLRQKNTEIESVAEQLEVVSVKLAAQEAESLRLRETLDDERARRDEEIGRLVDEVQRKNVDLEAASMTLAIQKAETQRVQETLVADHVRLDGEVEWLSGEVRRKNAEVETIGRELEDVRTKYEVRQAETQRLLETLESERTNTMEMEAQAEEWNTAVQRLSELLQQKNTELESVTGQLDDVLAKFAAQEAETLRLRETLDTERVRQDKEVERLSDELRQKYTELESVGRELESVSVTCTQHEAESVRLHESLETERIKHAQELEAQTEQHNEALERLSDQLRQRKIELESIGEELQAASVTSGRLETEAQHLQQTLDNERVVQIEAMEKMSDQVQQKDAEFQSICRQLEAVSAKFAEKESEGLCLQDTLENERIQRCEETEKLSEQLRQKTAEVESISGELERVFEKFAEKEAEALCLQKTLENERFSWNDDAEKLTNQLRQKTAELESQSRELEDVSAKFAEKESEALCLQEAMENERLQQCEETEKLSEQLRQRTAEVESISRELESTFEKFAAQETESLRLRETLENERVRWIDDAEKLTDELRQKTAELEFQGRELEDVSAKFAEKAAETVRLMETLDRECVERGEATENLCVQLRQKDSDLESVGKQLDCVTVKFEDQMAETHRLQETLESERVKWDEDTEKLLRQKNAVCRELDVVSVTCMTHEADAVSLRTTLDSERIKHTAELEALAKERDAAVFRLSDELQRKTYELESTNKESEAVSVKFAERQSEAVLLRETLDNERIQRGEQVEGLLEQLRQKNTEIESITQELEAVSKTAARLEVEAQHLQEALADERVVHSMNTRFFCLSVLL